MTETKKQQARDRASEWRKKNRLRGLLSVREWRKKNKDRVKFLSIRWREKNKQRSRENSSSWYFENRATVLARSKKWAKANSDLARKYKRERFRALPDDSNERLKCRIATRIRMALGPGRKSGMKTESLVGCSIPELKAHISALFGSTGMTWENRREWHIDHIIPCRAFDLSNPDQQRLCFHFSNLRPIWAKDNLSKNDKILVGTKLISARKIA